MDLKILAEHAVIISKLFAGPSWLDTVTVTHTHTHIHIHTHTHTYKHTNSEG